MIGGVGEGLGELLGVAAGTLGVCCVATQPASAMDIAASAAARSRLVLPLVE